MKHVRAHAGKKHAAKDSVSYAQKETEAPRSTVDISKAQAATARLMAMPFLCQLYLVSPILPWVCSAPNIQVKAERVIGELSWPDVLPESFGTGSVLDPGTFLLLTPASPPPTPNLLLITTS